MATVAHLSYCSAVVLKIHTESTSIKLQKMVSDTASWCSSKVIAARCISDLSSLQSFDAVISVTGSAPDL